MKLFDSVPVKRRKANKFDLSHERKLSLNMGQLIPVLVQDVLPGDSFRVNSETIMRLAPMLAPMMHRVNVFTHYFFVPNRLVWNEWEDFITGGRDGLATPVAPYMQISDSVKTSFGLGSLADHLGVPYVNPSVTVTQTANISALPFRAYQLIYDEYFRDQNLIAPIDPAVTSGQVTGAELTKITTLRTRAWQKDYFTSALPWAQRGATVQLPLASTATVNYLSTSNVKTSTGTTMAPSTLLGNDATAGFSLKVNKASNTGTGTDGRIENISSVGVNTTLDVNQLRRSVQLQKFLEIMARGGARYIEQIKSMWGVISDDARLQRPEYLGGGISPITVSEVLSTYQDPSGTGNPAGNLYGHGVGVGNSNGFARTFKEHGYIIGILSVLPKTAYQQGIPRHFRRFDKLDYAWPVLAEIGEQEVKLGELYYNQAGAASEVDETFGYQSRFSEYKYNADTVHGAFRTTNNFWHMGRIFSSKPVLNQSFVEADPTKRVFAVQTAGVESLYCQIYHKIDALRVLPYFGAPTI